jgi:hypothetical protein
LHWLWIDDDRESFVPGFTSYVLSGTSYVTGFTS